MPLVKERRDQYTYYLCVVILVQFSELGKILYPLTIIRYIGGGGCIEGMPERSIQ